MVRQTQELLLLRGERDAPANATVGIFNRAEELSLLMKEPRFHRVQAYSRGVSNPCGDCERRGVAKWERNVAATLPKTSVTRGSGASGTLFGPHAVDGRA